VGGQETERGRGEGHGGLLAIWCLSDGPRPSPSFGGFPVFGAESIGRSSARVRCAANSGWQVNGAPRLRMPCFGPGLDSCPHSDVCLKHARFFPSHVTGGHGHGGASTCASACASKVGVSGQPESVDQALRSLLPSAVLAGGNVDFFRQRIFIHHIPSIRITPLSRSLLPAPCTLAFFFHPPVLLYHQHPIAPPSFPTSLPLLLAQCMPVELPPGPRPLSSGRA
jgi:hypothetical protein